MRWLWRRQKRQVFVVLWRIFRKNNWINEEMAKQWQQFLGSGVCILAK